MADPHGSRGLAGAAPKIAIGAAILALGTSLIAVVVVASRGGADPAPAAATAGGSAGSAKAGGAPPMPPVKRVEAADVVKLRREAVTAARDAGKPIGVRVTDEELRRALDLGADDVITAIAGRAIEREFDVLEAMIALRRLRPSTVYVELLRDGEPVLVRWKVEGDLSAARLADSISPVSPISPRRGLLGLGGSGSAFDLLAPDPFTPASDPLADTIKKLGDLAYEVPRSTVERVFAAPSAYARAARVVPSHRGGGFKVYAIRPGTLLAAIGIQNGDTIRAINGHAVSTVDEVADLYPQIKDEKEWRIDLDRRGRPALLTLTIK